MPAKKRTRKDTPKRISGSAGFANLRRWLTPVAGDEPLPNIEYMTPKRTSGSAGSELGGLSVTPVAGEPSPNIEYMTAIQTAWNAVKEALPEMMMTNCALPLRESDAAAEGPLQGLTGFSAPWSQELYDEKYPTLTDTEGMDCALALSSLDVLGSMTPWIPFDEQRVRHLIPICFHRPKQFAYKVIIPVDFMPATGLPSSPMTHCMPPELIHALILAIADAIAQPNN